MKSNKPERIYSLAEHNRLAKLYKEDPEVFEVERDRLVEELILAAPEEFRPGLWDFQKAWDETIEGMTPEEGLAWARITVSSYLVNTLLPALNAMLESQGATKH